VSTIVVEKNRAVGVKLVDGREQRADIIISNAYGPSTIFGMLSGQYAPRSLLRRYRHAEDRIEMGIHVSLGVARDLTKEPHAIVFPLKSPVEVDGARRERLFIQTFGHDPSLAPEGKGVIKVLLPTSWARWEELAKTPRHYQEEQERIGRTIIETLEQRFPGITTEVEVVDVATPISTRRFTGVGPGFGFSIPELLSSVLLGQNAGRTLPGLRNFYMVGQWAGSPGVPMVAAMGRALVRDICERDRRRFRTEAPARTSAGRRPAWRGAA
jgi:phytoene dehydrogenase-like protein